MFSRSVIKEIDEIQGKYPDAKSALLPALYIAQREYGWLNSDAMSCVAQCLNIPEAKVRETASFYSMFRHEPAGRHVIQLCTNISCMILGAENLIGFLKENYGLQPGGSSEDGRFSLVTMECIGACGTAPAMLVDTDFYNNLSKGSIGAILEKYP